MPVTITPEITTPARITAVGSLDFRASVDIVDLLELTAPEAADLDFTAVGQVSAEALSYLAAALRRIRSAGRQVVVLHAAPYVELLLTLVGINELGPVEEPVSDSGGVAA